MSPQHSVQRDKLLISQNILLVQDSHKVSAVPYPWPHIWHAVGLLAVWKPNQGNTFYVGVQHTTPACSMKLSSFPGFQQADMSIYKPGRSCSNGRWQSASFLSSSSDALCSIWQLQLVASLCSSILATFHYQFPITFSLYRLFQSLTPSSQQHFVHHYCIPSAMLYLQAVLPLS